MKKIYEYARNEYSQNGTSVKELVDFGKSIGYEFIGMSGVVNEWIGNTFFIREDFKDKFEVTKLDWSERGVLLTNGIPYIK